MRYFKAKVAYDGTNFAGFQWQREQRTVQATLETAVARISAGHSRVTAAGRTDAGVHALGQVVSFGAQTSVPLNRMTHAMNGGLPPDVSVRFVDEVDAQFSARFSASSRVYGYLALNRRCPEALMRRYSAFVPEDLDLAAMQLAGSRLLGEHCFRAFANELGAEEHGMRRLMDCRVRRRGRFVCFRIEANAFLRGMARTIVGTLLEIGAGKRDPSCAADLLRLGDRRLAGPSAPAQGLYLVRARYGSRVDYSAGRNMCAEEQEGHRE
ncbi:MAG TPA: tRNA pseudouridine(38-40) synthase TruA [Chthonomonadales bacterium]|nr:tRNA pseudouridine(38-40) synthase TruA [Chthonomonadales bacterium]